MYRSRPLRTRGKVRGQWLRVQQYLREGHQGRFQPLRDKALLANRINAPSHVITNLTAAHLFWATAMYRSRPLRTRGKVRGQWLRVQQYLREGHQGRFRPLRDKALLANRINAPSHVITNLTAAHLFWATAMYRSRPLRTRGKVRGQWMRVQQYLREGHQGCFRPLRDKALLANRINEPSHVITNLTAAHLFLTTDG